LRNLQINLEQQGYDIKEIPLIMQYNKRDLPNIASLAELRSALNPYNAPEIEACASEGKGVFESLKTVSKSIINVLKGGTTL
jgi:signal recognition particle receptor subunit beta